MKKVKVVAFGFAKDAYSFLSQGHDIVIRPWKDEGEQEHCQVYIGEGDQGYLRSFGEPLISAVCGYVYFQVIQSPQEVVNRLRGIFTTLKIDSDIPEVN